MTQITGRPAGVDQMTASEFPPRGVVPVLHKDQGGHQLDERARPGRLVGKFRVQHPSAMILDGQCLRRLEQRDRPGNDGRGQGGSRGRAGDDTRPVDFPALLESH